ELLDGLQTGVAGPKRIDGQTAAHSKRLQAYLIERKQQRASRASTLPGKPGERRSLRILEGGRQRGYHRIRIVPQACRQRSRVEPWRNWRSEREGARPFSHKTRQARSCESEGKSGHRRARGRRV